MSEREKFFRNLSSISSSFSEYISVYYAIDLNNLLGISYLELNRVSNELSQYFLNVFGEHSQFVGVSVSDYFLLPCIILGIWKSGNCFSGLGTQYTKKNNLEFLNFLNVKFLITDSNKSEYEGELISYFFIHRWKFFVWVRPTKKLNEIYLKDICFGIMTSGSAGEPKIIQVPWSCIISNAIELSSKFQVMQEDIIFLASPCSFDPFFIEFFMAILNGCSLMIVSNAIKLSSSNLLKILFDSSEKCDSDFSYTDYEHPDNENYIHIKLQKVCKKNISILQMTPSVFKRWTDAEIQNTILSSQSKLRILILGGEKFPKEILKLKHPHNTTRIFNIYGITEISCWAFLNELTTNFSRDSETSIGKPLQDIVYKISTNGELEIGSNKRVCLINKEKTFQVDHSVFRNTGDIVKLLNNEIHYVGRTNQIFKKYGMKINLSKIEDCFNKENKLIKECVCIFDEEKLKLGLFYVPVEAEAEEINYKLLKAEEFLKKNYLIPVDSVKTIEVPDYLIEISKIPVNQHGKCDRHELLQYLKRIEKSEKVRPDLEIIFRKVWTEVLGIKKVTSLSFLESGGDSVLGLGLLNKLEDEGVSIPQNFIVDLLSGKSYDDCLRCLSHAEDKSGKSGIPKKKFRINEQVKDVGISLMWKFDLGKCVDASPVIFLFEGEERLVIGSHSSKLSCISPNSGCEIWTTFLGDRIESGFRPTKDGGRGFIGCYDHYIYCIATPDGSIIWKFLTGDMVKSTPCLSNNQEIVYVASYDRHLYCLSTTDGEAKESLKLSNGGIFCSGITSDSPNYFFLATLDGTCVALDQETNKPAWKISLESPVFASPCLMPEKPKILFAEVLGYVHCLNAFNGEKMWTFKAGGNVYSSPTVGVFDGVNHIIFGCHDAHLYCLRHEKEPELKWKEQLDSSVFAKPLIVAEFSSICAPTTKGLICLCDFNGGSVKARLQLDGEVFSSPVYYNNRLFVGCRDNYVYSLRVAEAKES